MRLAIAPTFVDPVRHRAAGLVHTPEVTEVPDPPDLLELLDEACCRIHASTGLVVAANARARRLGIARGSAIVDAIEAGGGLDEAVRLLERAAVGTESSRQVALANAPGSLGGLRWTGRIGVRLVAAGAGQVFAVFRALPAEDVTGSSLRRLRHALEILDRLAKRAPGTGVPMERMATWLAAAVGVEDCVVVDRVGDGPFRIRSVTGPRFEGLCEEVLAAQGPAAVQSGAELARRIAAHHPTAEAGRFVRVGRVPGGIRGAILVGRIADAEAPKDERDRVLRIAARLLETRGAADDPRSGRALAVVVAADAGTRTVLRTALELRGHPVVDASDAGTARTLIATDAAAGLLVIAREESVALPLAEEVAACRPDVAVVWCTGAGQHRRLPRQDQVSAPVAVLETPFLPEELERVLRSCEPGGGTAAGVDQGISAPRAPD